MKKIALTFGILLIMSVTCFGVGIGMGLRSAAMGGAGIALANDTSAAYLNPAGLMSAPDGFISQAYFGTASNNMEEVFKALSSGDSFITDYFDKEVVGNATVTGGLGFGINKVGFAVIADGLFEFNKPKDSLNIDYTGALTETFPITIGTNYSLFMLPEVAFGMNIKPIAQQAVVTSITSSGATGTGSTDIALGSGFGIDVGAQTKITPWLTAGVVVRNLVSSINSDVTSTGLKVYYTGTVETTGEIKRTGNTSLPMEVGVGVASIIPATGTILAADMEMYGLNNTSYTDLHLGVEQKLLFNVLALRMGYYTYGPLSDSYYTIGAEINMGFELGISSANSVTDSTNNVIMFGFGSAI
ncbi:hypothetical protein ACFLZ2_04930 [Candidatus Margulisiibacteriota bacterium]